MIFIIPIILGAAALASAIAGVAAGADGASKMQQADKIGKDAQGQHERQQKFVEEAVQETQQLAEEYGKLQIQVKTKTVNRFIKFIEQIGQCGSQGDLSFLEGLDGVSPQQIAEYKAAALEAQQFAKGGVKAVGAAYAAGQGTIGLIGLFGTASTGTAIGGLSGAAAWNATLAWLGGGSLAAGGGGMALGTIVLGGITVGPALMIGGFVLGGQGEKALTEAYKYEAQINTEIAKLSVFKDFLRQVQQRITELERLIKTLDTKANLSLSHLELQPFDRDRDTAKFQQVGLLIAALSEIMKTPVLDDAGDLNSTASMFQARYGSISDESDEQ